MTQFAHVTDDTIDAVGRLPTAARRLDTGEWVMGLRDADPALVAETGWLPIAKTPKPDDTPTTRHTRTVELVAGTPTEVWTPVAKTPEEQAAEADEADREADAQAIRDDLPTLISERDQAATQRDDANLERARMTEGDPEFQNRWTPLDGTGSNGQRIAALETLVNHLLNGQRRQWGDLRAGFGNDRSIAAALIRKLRKDRDDQ